MKTQQRFNTKKNRCCDWFVAPMQLARQRNVNRHFQFTIHIFRFFWWNSCFVAIAFFACNSKISAQTCIELKVAAITLPIFLLSDHSLSLKNGLKGVQNGDFRWAVCYPRWFFVARANLVSSSALPRKYRIFAFSVCFTWSQHCLTFFLLVENLKRSVCSYFYPWMTFLVETGSEMQRLHLWAGFDQKCHSQVKL